MPITHSTNDNDLEINLETEVVKFINVLKTLPDTRDNRGKRHSLVFLIVTVVFSVLSQGQVDCGFMSHLWVNSEIIPPYFPMCIK
jgi:hypothetical protein